MKVGISHQKEYVILS